ncbi:hypothetical protein PFNF135_01541, partial [Plasmodium falciparum NF135/5.C10]
MVPPGGRQGGSGEDGIDDKDAKHLLDSIGKKVYKEKVKNGEAKNYINELKVLLSLASTNSELNYTNDPCQLIKEKRDKLLGGNSNRYPCESLSGKDVNRFSDTLGGQCTNEKMRSGGKGACAPYRRLHLCHHNLETIDTKSTTHKLLAEVCYAAKHEGESLRGQHGQHKGTNNESQLCTVLARSFADIGDIVRGRDLYLGNPQEKTKREQLENKLKEIFGNIYEELKNGKTNGQALQARYKDTDNYYELREDWWDANRETVWKAITCSAATGNKYFRPTCGDSGDEKHSTLASNKCRCGDDKKPNDQVPTYFDYVPQYLRWFEEWAEDFCRLRKHKLENAKSKCRGKDKSGNDKYCDLNRYDCEKTASGKHDFFEEDDCIGCHHSCSHFVNWIDNQKLEFLKQREKYKSEIKKYTNGQSRGTGGSKRKKRSAHGGSNDNGYEKNFYEKLKEKNKYVKVDGFLELLNKEDVCTKKLNDQDEEEGKIDFKNVKSSSASGDGSNKTFYRTTYCEACPWCGAQKKSGGGWEAKNEDCANEVTKEYNEQDTTTIEILTPEEGQSDILKKYNKFCKNGANGEKSVIDGGQIKKWQCYYDKDKPSGQNNNCVQGEWKDFKKGQKVTSYNAFFWDWVHDMLHDSIEWRDEHGKCINKDNGNTCISGCKKKCDCFQKWVQQKESEWENVKKHFKKQKDIVKEETLLGGVMTHDFVLEGVLKDGNLLQNIKDVHGDTDDIKHIEELLKDEEATGAIAGGENNTTIDKLLKHEEQDAKQCLEKQEECEKKKQQPKP